MISRKSKILAAIVLLFAVDAANAKPARSVQNWGGSDFSYSCDTVRSFRGFIEGLSPEARRSLISRFNVSPKQVRQATACLRKG